MVIKETWFDAFEHSCIIGVNKHRKYQKPDPTKTKKWCEVMFPYGPHTDQLNFFH